MTNKNLEENKCKNCKHNEKEHGVDSTVCLCANFTPEKESGEEMNQKNNTQLSSGGNSEVKKLLSENSESVKIEKRVMEDYNHLKQVDIRLYEGIRLKISSAIQLTLKKFCEDLEIGFWDIDIIEELTESEKAFSYNFIKQFEGLKKKWGLE